MILFINSYPDIYKKTKFFMYFQVNHRSKTHTNFLVPKALFGNAKKVTMTMHSQSGDWEREFKNSLLNFILLISCLPRRNVMDTGISWFTKNIFHHFSLFLYIQLVIFP